MHRSFRLAPLPLVLVLLVVAAPAQAAQPKVLLVQGALFSEGGGPVSDASYGMTFAFYDGKDEAAKQLYAEANPGVKVAGGLFTALIGSVLPNFNPLPADLFAKNPDIWIGVAVGGDPELPRVRIATVAFSFQAEHATIAESAKLADAAKLADLATESTHALTADEASHATKADAAKQADQANLATSASVAEVANKALVAEQSKQADLASALACTGCVLATMLDPVALAAGTHSVVPPSTMKATTVQGAIEELLARLATLEKAIVVSGNKIGIGVASPGCALDLADGVCVGGLKTHAVYEVASLDAMNAITAVGSVAYRSDTDDFWARSSKKWRKIQLVQECGDGIADPPAEECDDGNGVSTDACVVCKKAKCGDGFVYTGVEECDDGAQNANTADKCRTSCVKPKCGDSIQDSAEQCDLGAQNGQPGSTCDAGCKSTCADPCKNYGATKSTINTHIKLCSTPGVWGAWDNAKLCDGWHVCTVTDWAAWAPAQKPSETIWIANNSCGSGQHHEVHVSYNMNDASCYDGSNCCWNDNSSLPFAICK